MEYREATKLVMQKLKGEQVDEEALKQALAEYPQIGQRLKAALHSQPPAWAMDGLKQMAELRKKASQD